MAGSGWDPSGIEAAITISVDGQAATRVGDSAYDSVRGLAGRSKGRRYFEITPETTIYDSFCSAGFVDANASLDVELGAGTPIAGGWQPASGMFRYSYLSGSGSRADQDNVTAGVLGVLIDFDTKTCTVYRDGVIDWVESMDIPDDTVLYPAASLYRDTSVELQTVEPFQYPPEVSFTAWDKPDASLASKVAGNLRINDVAASRLIKAFSYERLTYTLNGNSITESKPLGQTVSDPLTGDYNITLRDGFPRDVFVIAFDEYGEEFTPGKSVSVGERIHPTTPNGYVYECSGSGALPETEPTWSTEPGASQSVGSASFITAQFYRPMVHGPLKPEITNWSPEELFLTGSTGIWLDPSDLSTLFQDAAGTTPVTGAGQPVGRIEDKSGAGLAAVQANSGSRPTLQSDGNGNHYLSFDGVDDHLVMDHNAALNMAPGATAGIAFLMRQDSSVRIFEKRTYSGANLPNSHLASHNHSFSPGYIYGDQISSQGLGTGAHRHCVIWDGTKKITFVDGIRKIYSSANGNATLVGDDLEESTNVTDNDGPLVIGAQKQSAGSLSLVTDFALYQLLIVQEAVDDIKRELIDNFLSELIT